MTTSYDRIIIQGTLPPFCYADGMTSFLYKHKIRIFDYKQHFAQPLRDAIIHNAKQLAHDNGLTIEFLYFSPFLFLKYTFWNSR